MPVDDSADINFRFTLCSNTGALNYNNVVLEIDSWIGRTWTAIRINIDTGATVISRITATNITQETTIWSPRR